MSEKTDLWWNVGASCYSLARALEMGDEILGRLSTRALLTSLSLLPEAVREEIADVCLHPEKADE